MIMVVYSNYPTKTIMTQKERKRLTPTKDTLRELYLKSGNQCAFPECTRLMIDSDGKFVGQICHIEAAEQGGERFNPKQTNEECRGFANLVLMCYEHHVATNDVAKYKVSDLQQLKAEHEAKFTNVEDKLDKAFQSQVSVPSRSTISQINSPGSIATIGQTGNNYVVNHSVAPNKKPIYFKKYTNPEFDSDKKLYRTHFFFGSEHGVGLTNPKVTIRFREEFLSIGGSIMGGIFAIAGKLHRITHNDKRGFEFETDFLQPNNFMVIETESITVPEIDSIVFPEPSS